jgi:hypothetical protein
MPSQSRRMSLIEACTSVAIGYLVSLAANLIVLPMFGYAVTVRDALGISVVFTALALARGYCVRRLFEAFR